ncbi:MAG TPA: hypothetical protein VHX60_17065 [Acidobacteriaceae bacterium]|nr:hypothetical protein [Acidobacteriaceae bacterium]
MTAFDTETVALPAGFAPDSLAAIHELPPVPADKFGGPLDGGCLRGFMWAAVIEGSCLLIVALLAYFLVYRS